MKAPGAMQISGIVRPDVASIDVTFRRNGHSRRRAAYVSQIDNKLARRVGASGPFGVVEFAVRGCVPSDRFRLEARMQAESC